MSIRTDLAVEMIDEDAASLPKGIKRKLRKSSACSVTEIIVADDAAGARIGKTKGRYITIETDRLSASPMDFEEQVDNIAEEIISLKGEHRKTALIAGLGNSDITPDALGPMVISQIIATRHLHKELPDGHELKQLNRVSAIAPGVLGQTGIEAAEIIRSLCDTVKPDCVIVIDALACSDISGLVRQYSLPTRAYPPVRAYRTAARSSPRKPSAYPLWQWEYPPLSICIP